MDGQGNAYSEPLFQGREKDAKDIIDLISATGDEKIFKVIAIYGMGGVGKTSLAKHVYQCQKFKNATFDKRAFVTVNNHPFDAKELIDQLTMEFKKNDVPKEKGKDGTVTTKLNGLVVTSIDKTKPSLDTLLEGKNCLVVLDDLSTSDSEPMDAILQQLIEKTAKASRTIVIVTTREKEIAKRCSEKAKGHMHELQRLAEMDAWNLFTEKVLPYALFFLLTCG